MSGSWKMKQEEGFVLSNGETGRLRAFRPLPVPPPQAVEGVIPPPATAGSGGRPGRGPDVTTPGLQARQYLFWKAMGCERQLEDETGREFCAL